MIKKFLLAAAISAISASLASANTITWSPASNISGNADVATAGMLVQASNIGDSSTPGTTINGVTFSPFAMNNTNSVTSGVFTLSASFAIAGYSGYGSTNAPFSTISSAYQSLLSFGNYGSANAPMTLTVSGLTPGNSYLFQFWVNDSRGAYGTQPETASAGNTVALFGNVSGAAGGIGQYVIGNFVADAATQSVVFAGGSGAGTTQGAFQLRDLGANNNGGGGNNVPDQGSTILLLSSGLIALGAARRKMASI